jgi:peptide/nickel transport system substrate-binding protein
MLRGFRWQLLALVLAAGLFAASLIVRNQPSPTPQTDPSPPTSTQVQTEPSPSPTDAPSPIDAATLDVSISSVSRVTFREGVVGAVSRINPVFATTNVVDRDIAALIYEGLTRTNGYGEPQPLLADRWVVSSDGLEYVFRLRNDVLWQDGTSFSSADVAYTMGILRDPAFPGDPELGRFWRTVETEILGDHIVRFRLTQPLGTFLDHLQIGILPEHALRGTNAEQLATHPMNLSPIGTGAYQLEGIVLSAEGIPQTIRLRAATTYRSRAEVADHAHIEQFDFTLYPTFDAALSALSDGAVDGLAARTPEERAQLMRQQAPASFEIYTQTDTTLGALIFNWGREDASLLREQRVRVALQAGLDRSSIIDRNLTDAAVPANSPLIPGSWAYLAELPWAPYDPAASLSQLATASERLSASEAPTPDVTPTEAPSTFFDLSILTPDTPSMISLANEIAAQWSQLNVNATVEIADEESYRRRLTEGEFVAALVEYSLGSSADPDVYPFWNQGQTPPDGLNYGAADDGRISELLERARREPSGINRIALYREFQQEFARRAIALPLYYPLFTYAVSEQFDAIQLGFLGSPSDRFRTIADWRVR